MTATALQVESGISFAEFADKIVAERTRFIRGPAKEANRYGLHVRTACFAEMPLETIRPRHVGEWHVQMQAKTASDRRAVRPLSKATIERCHALVSVVFGEAVRRDLITSNPCTSMQLRMPATEGDTKEKWAYLTIEEQRAILACDAIPEWDKRGMQFAWGTGLRQGEQCNLELRDVHVDGDEPFVFVRFGSPGLPPKSGKTRRVPLFGDGLVGARALVEIAKTVPNPHGLLFPGKTGGRRSVGKPLGRSVRIDGKWTDLFHVHVRTAGITRTGLKWHSMRHTCASSLVMGSWGRAWRLEEIKELLGHSNTNVTQMYAHLGESALKAAARETAVAISPLDAARATFVAKGPEEVRRYVWASGLIRKVIDRAAGIKQTMKSIIEEARHVA